MYNPYNVVLAVVVVEVVVVVVVGGGEGGGGSQHGETPLVQNFSHRCLCLPGVYA